MARRLPAMLLQRSIACASQPYCFGFVIPGIITSSTSTSTLVGSARCDIRRHLHARIAPPPVPPPTPFCPNAETFLKLIGRGLSKHAAKFPTWESLFTTTSPQLREAGLEPPRARRYLLRWREKFRRGEFGIGGDLSQVSEQGVGEIRVVQIATKVAADKKSSLRKAIVGATAVSTPHVSRPEADGGVVQQSSIATLTRSPGAIKVVLNVAHGTQQSGLISGTLATSFSQDALRSAKSISGVKIKRARFVSGPHLEPLKGSRGAAAVIKPKEGMWEHVRGHKIDGGERRKAEVRAKRRSAQRRAGT